MPRPSRRLWLEPLEGRVNPVSFGSPTEYMFGGNSGFSAAGDFDGDGDLDVVVADFVAGVIPMVNTGAGAFTVGAALPIKDVRSVRVVDMDGDGKQDIVAASGRLASGGSGENVAIARGNGDGTFAAPITRPIADPQALTVADFNGDGRPDVAVVANHLFVMLNNGTATTVLDPPVRYVTDSDGLDLTAADFNGDGKPDVAISGNTTTRVDVLLNTGTGAFGEKVSYPLTGRGGGIAAADLDRDGRPELLVTRTFGGQLSVLKGNTDGTFQAPVVYTAPSPHGPGPLAVADYDLDGNLDVVGSSFHTDGIVLWTGTGEGTLNTPVVFNGGIGPSGITAADVTGDGRPDLVAPQRSSPGGVKIYPNTTGVLRVPSPVPVHRTIPSVWKLDP
ncbi:VCBS repeat-containing protein, partial [bacterium]|nr:VCBS repeat-containing protein [bacterium]